MPVLCVRCTETKPDQDFYWRPERQQFRQPCKACYAADTKARYEKQPGRRQEIVAASYRRNREATYARTRSRELARFNGMTPQQYQAMLEEQGGLCAICKQPETVVDKRLGSLRSLAVDHCHTSELVRGLLCYRCNIAIGLFADDVDRLRSAIQYLTPGGSSTLEVTDANCSEAIRPEAAA